MSMKSTDSTILKRKIGIKLIAAALILIGLALLFSTIIRPNVISVCEYNTKAITLNLIDNAINRRLDRLDNYGGYNSLVKLSYTEGGQVASIETNTALINRIRTDMLTEINNCMVDGYRDKALLSAGTLSGIPLFHGMGPSVEMTIEPAGYADAVFISEFSDAGLNQTLHRIIMRTTVNVTAFIPLYSVETEVKGDFLIAETIIVGDVPESFTHVVSSDKDVIDTINDYQAEPYD